MNHPNKIIDAYQPRYEGNMNYYHELIIFS